LQCNLEVMHLRIQGLLESAIASIERPIAASVLEQTALMQGLKITTPIASRINGSSKTVHLLGFKDNLKLTPRERGEIIDAQALQLLGTIQRLKGENETAKLTLTRAYNRALAVRDGRVTSITRLRAQTLSELAMLAEAQGNFSEAEQLLRESLNLLDLQYPETRTVNGAKARLAAFLLKRGKQEEARGFYREVIDSSLGKRGAISGLTNHLAPYFQLMSEESSSADEFFRATQILVRPGVAETQAILSRKLSAGTDDAARLFRQSTDLSRSIERLRMRFSALGKAEETTAVRQQRNDLSTEIETLERNQQLTQVRLSDYPQYRVVASNAMELSELRDTMTSSEAYLRMSIVGDDIFMFYADQKIATAYKIDIDEDQLDRIVDQLRASISILEDGQYITYPFEIELARTLYKTLFDPIASHIADKSHLIFEPDGGMLRLPINLLVADDRSVQAYLDRTADPESDLYDYRGVNWLGSTAEVSTSVSARAFIEARKAPKSKASRQYLGLGKNKPMTSVTQASDVRGATGTPDANCQWPISEWNKPIADTELVLARSIIGSDRSDILTEAEFTDQDIMSNSKIGDYRILHFATHGLVTAPKPSCPAKPALLTSFADQNGSDGLLAFDEIFDLKLDADLVILSACDTAGKASIAATRAAGVSSGGGTALDGLVRSFIGAGSRSVLASHWPVPDSFKATERLIGGLFTGGDGSSIAGALKKSQLELMNDPNTSHPYYWSGFAVIGDGARPFLVSQPIKSSDIIAASVIPFNQAQNQ